MQFRDMMFLAIGTILAFLGIIASLTWSIEVGLAALLALGLLILILILLQRRQLSRVQQRTLTLLHAQQTTDSSTRPVQRDSVQTLDNLAKSTRKVQQDLSISTKKVVGLLQAQHLAVELLNHRLEESLADKSNERPHP